MRPKKCENCGHKHFWKNKHTGYYGDKIIEYLCKKCGKEYY